MTKDLPKVLDVPVLTGHGRMRDKLDALERSWNHAPASDCHRGGAWSGEIDTRLRPSTSAHAVCVSVGGVMHGHGVQLIAPTNIDSGYSAIDRLYPVL